MNKSDIFWQTYLNLEKEMIEVSRYIFITDEITVRHNGTETTQSYDAQLNTFSPHLADYCFVPGVLYVTDNNYVASFGCYCLAKLCHFLFYVFHFVKTFIVSRNTPGRVIYCCCYF